MKKILIIGILLLGLQAFGQPPVKVYAFEQDVLPGTIHTANDENGNAVKKDATKKNYFVYLSFKKNYSLTPVQVIIKGNGFEVKNSEVKKSPVKFINNNIPQHLETIILVPATKNKVIQLQWSDTPMEIKKSTVLKKLIKKNDIVIVYLWKKKKYFAFAEKLKKLEPVANE